MAHISEAAHQCRLELGRKVSDILESALACEPAGGTSPQWLYTLNGLQVEPLDQSVRYDEAKKAGQEKGAPVCEVEKCLQTLIDNLKLQAPVVVEELTPFLERIVPRHREQYLALASISPKPKAGPSGGMFAFALATAEKKSKEQEYQGSTYVLRCPGCGGPRMSDADLSCEYCGEGKTTS